MNIFRRTECGKPADVVAVDTREPVAGSVSIGGRIIHLSSSIHMTVWVYHPSLTGVDVANELFFLDEAQIADDCQQALSDDRFRIAGKIKKRIKFVILPFQLRYNSLWNSLFAFGGCRKRRKWDLVAAPPNWHFGAMVIYASITSVNHLIDRAGIKQPVISFGQHCQICWLRIELGALWTRTFGIGAVASRAIQ